MESPLVRWLVVASAALLVVVSLVINAWWPKQPNRSPAQREAANDFSETTPAPREVRSASRPERMPRMRTRVAGASSSERAALTAPSPDHNGGLDPEALAIWEEVNAADQEVLQPEDLEVEPPAPPLDLRTIPAYRAENVDADGNLN